LRAYVIRGQILEGKGDPRAAKKTYEEGLAFAKTLPPDTAKAALSKL
jgi:hypothetical protein